MGIDARCFSKQKFEAISSDVVSLKQLLSNLESVVMKDIDVVLKNEIAEIVNSLNKAGHKLKLFYPPNPGDISYRDDQERDGVYTCDLRLAVDVFVSVGFADVDCLDNDLCGGA